MYQAKAQGRERWALFDALLAAGLSPRVLCLETTESVLLDDTDSRDRAVVAGIVDLGHAFGLTTVAEGVETAEQLAQLNALGCGLAQGYYFCRPLPPDEAVGWMRSRDVVPATTGVPIASRSSPERTRVLVVDDQRSMRDLLRWTMDDDQHFLVVAEAGGGREAVARQYQPDLVLLAMPGVGGLEALPLIRAVAPRARVVVVSALEPADIADQALGEGADGYLCKGASPDRFLEDLRAIMGSAAAADLRSLRGLTSRQPA